MKIPRRFTQAGTDPLATVEYEKRTSRISNPDGSVVFEMGDAEIPKQWSQLATDIMVSKYFRKAGVPQEDGSNGPEKSVKQVVHRLAGCWRHWGQSHGYFDLAEDAQAFYDEIVYMLLHQMCAPNSPQWFNTGLHWAYGITGPSQGHYYCEADSGELKKAEDAYSHPQPHACFIQSIKDDLVNSGGIMDLWTREARLFKYGSGTGSNFSRLRGENEALSGGGKSSGLMSFLKIGDRAAGAIKSGGTTRRAAKMVCLDLDHPDVEQFINWKVREELKVAAMVEGLKHLPGNQQELAKKLGLKLDYDFNGEAYYTVSGQNSNNSLRIPNRFFAAVEEDGDWNLTDRNNGKIAVTLKARDLWEQVAFAAWRCADPGVQFDDTINQWHTCPKSGRINASNPCVTGDTRVLTPGGIWRRIDQMIHLPSRVITNLEGQEIHITDGAFPTGTKDVFELSTAGGYSVKLTADHRLWTRRRGWVMAVDLLPSDQLALPAQPACVQEIGEPQDPRFFQLLGLFISQSNNDAGALHLDACLPASEQVESFAGYVAETWGQRAYNDDYVNQLMVDPSDHERDGSESAEHGNTITATLTNRRLLSRLSAFVRVDGGARRLSDDAFTAGLAAQKHLLRALFTADAQITSGAVELPSKSAVLLHDVQLLLCGFGVQSAVVNAKAEKELVQAVLRIDHCGLHAFGKYIGLLPGRKLEALAQAVSFALTPTQDSVLRTEDCHWDRVASLTYLGKHQVFDLTEPVTHSFIANGMTVHNCSEYMFLDDTACNLASLNVLSFFDPLSRRFDIESFKHAVRLWTIVLEISVLMASFPSEEIALLSYRFRTLGLGYANLGAMLMQAGIPYDSDKGRAICAAITALLTGESYAASAAMSAQLGPFAGFQENREEMLRVIRNHRRAAHAGGDFEGLDIKPVCIDAAQFSAADPLASTELLIAARECWDRALALGEKHGYRNAQATVIAPTGTIGLLMDCDTTGVEPDFALVKFKKLAGGGYFKIANQSLAAALSNLSYSPEQINEIMRYVLGTLTFDGAPHINYESLARVGLSEAEIEVIETSLPSVFELSFAFSSWSLPVDLLNRLGIPENEWKSPVFNFLRRLGFTRKQIEQANEHICGRGTVEGAPHLRAEDYSVFDCANKCGKTGKRFIAVEGHIRMMAAAQPFVSGAISKTINLPNEASVQDIKNSYFLSWRLGLKANALYRDGSKLSQPLNVKSDEELDSVEADDEENVEAGRLEVALLAVQGAAIAANSELGTRNSELPNIEPAPEHTRVIEKIVERIVERPLRRRLPDTRHAVTHKFDVAGHEGYITVGLYEDGSPGEVFIIMAKEGSTIGGLMDTIATLVSVSLQYGVPVESLVRKFEHVRFEPAGMTRNPDIPLAKSLVDYIFRWFGMQFVAGYRSVHAPKREKAAPSPSPSPGSAGEGGGAGSSPEPRTLNPEPTNKGGNGHGPRMEPDTAKPFDYEGTAPKEQLGTRNSELGTNLRLAIVSDPLSQQSSHLQADAPACDVCGSITVRNATCYKCLNCGNSMGCS